MKSVIKVFINHNGVEYCEVCDSLKQYHKLVKEYGKYIVSECLATIKEIGFLQEETVYDSTILEA